MKILQNLEEKKLDRKKFIYTTGLLALGGFLLAKFPVKWISSKAEKFTQSARIQIQQNPYAVKRNNPNA